MNISMNLHNHADHHAHCKGPRGSPTTWGPTRDHHVYSGCIDITGAHERPPRLLGLYESYTGPTRDHHVHSGCTDVTRAHERPPRPLGLYRYHLGPRETTTSTRAVQILPGPTRDHHVYSGYIDITWAHERPPRLLGLQFTGAHERRTGPLGQQSQNQICIYTCKYTRYILTSKKGHHQEYRGGNRTSNPPTLFHCAPEVAGSTDRPQQSDHHPHTNE